MGHRCDPGLPSTGRLAWRWRSARGARFLNAYSYPTGSPTRATLPPILRDEPFTPAGYCVLTENFPPSLAPDVDGRYELIRFDDGRPEFYELSVDPLESTNLLDSATALSGAPQAAHDRLPAGLAAWSNVMPAARLVSSWHGADGFAVELTSTVPAVHQLQRRLLPSDTAWIDVGEPGTGMVVTLTDPATPAGAALYGAVSR